MAIGNSNLLAPAAPSALAALAEHLRDGPLQQLVLLQEQTTALADRLNDGPPGKVEDLEHLVRLSVLAMEHFNAFTREFATVLRDLTDAERSKH
jgi:hypothetical protein